MTEEQKLVFFEELRELDKQRIYLLEEADRYELGTTIHNRFINDANRVTETKRLVAKIMEKFGTDIAEYNEWAGYSR